MASAVLGISASQFDAAIAPLISKKYVKMNGRARYFFAPAFVKAYCDRAATMAVRDRSGGAEDGEEFGGDSPALERQRALRADLLEIELGQKRGELISVKDWEGLTDRIWGPIRRMGESMQRLFGREGLNLHRELVKELETELVVDAA